MKVPMSPHNLNELMHFFKKQSTLDLFYAIAVGNVDLKELKNFVVHGDKLQHATKEIKHDTKHAHDEDIARQRYREVNEKFQKEIEMVWTDGKKK